MNKLFLFLFFLLINGCTENNYSYFPTSPADTVTVKITPKVHYVTYVGVFTNAQHTNFEKTGIEYSYVDSTGIVTQTEHLVISSNTASYSVTIPTSLEGQYYFSVFAHRDGRKFPLISVSASIYVDGNLRATQNSMPSKQDAMVSVSAIIMKWKDAGITDTTGFPPMAGMADTTGLPQ